MAGIEHRLVFVQNGDLHEIRSSSMAAIVTTRQYLVCCCTAISDEAASTRSWIVSVELGKYDSIDRGKCRTHGPAALKAIDLLEFACRLASRI
jgi:hypothetical protein